MGGHGCRNGASLRVGLGAYLQAFDSGLALFCDAPDDMSNGVRLIFEMPIGDVDKAC